MTQLHIHHLFDAEDAEDYAKSKQASKQANKQINRRTDKQTNKNIDHIV